MFEYSRELIEEIQDFFGPTFSECLNEALEEGRHAFISTFLRAELQNTDRQKTAFILLSRAEYEHTAYKRRNMRLACLAMAA